MESIRDRREACHSGSLLQSHAGRSFHVQTKQTIQLKLPLDRTSPFGVATLPFAHESSPVCGSTSTLSKRAGRLDSEYFRGES
ncbi:hypothetical protein [Cohnella faecalis]|uniref:Uncharacterized protein n=1 Tax=Cohnella faecalis TaxID=2315694 RepID=A0A398CKN0_9BACL|nr:hypothetical protein [Cohnella faecalis]RIE03866.1 hypothetical protein D3H35_09970 [Cohnella faecalis]